MARVWVVVLGDFGRSPRMQYHALSLSTAGCDVTVLATEGARPIPQLLDAHNVQFLYFPQPAAWVARLPTLLSLAVKAAYQLAAMAWVMLVTAPKPAAILLQNPPAIPTLLVCWLAAVRWRAKLIIDWHNLAYSILQLKYGQRRAWLINLARNYEFSMGRRAATHFTVTKAMAAFLSTQLGAAAPRPVVLYDRPPAWFRPLIAAHERHVLLSRLQPDILSATIGAELLARHGFPGGAGCGARRWVFTESDGGAMRDGRPALVVSSTSWTPDEDFGLLLEAACLYDKRATRQSGVCGEERLPDVLFVITGRGPQREEYLARIQHLELHHVAFASVWLEQADYPQLLGAADLGVCLHTSSSGMDLPMKVVDMFGAGLPVCAVGFACVEELITPGRTGVLFKDAEGLADALLRLLTGFGPGPAPGGELEQLRKGVRLSEDSLRWDDNWSNVAWPVFADAIGEKRHKRS